jgi:hypothetical protein
LGKDQISFDDWYDFMSKRRESLGTANKSAWHVETIGYVEKIAGVEPGKTAGAPAVAGTSLKSPSPGLTSLPG